MKIHNLHMRYEDESADPGHPFAVGTCVDHLVVSPLTPHAEPEPSPGAVPDPDPGPDPTSEPGPEPGREPEPEPEPQPQQQQQREWNHSAARMPYRQWNGHEVSVYWLPDTAAYRPAATPGGDHTQAHRKQEHESFVQFMQQRPDPNHLVAPVSGIVRVTFADEYMRVHLVQSSLVHLEMSMRQMRDMNALRERINGASERRQIESIRRRYTYIGNKSLRALGGPRLWKQLWCFAGQCLAALHRRYRPRRMTWERLRLRRDQRRAYVALYCEEQIAAYAKAASMSAGSTSSMGGTAPVDAHVVVEQALLGELHPALYRHVQLKQQQQQSRGAAAAAAAAAAVAAAAAAAGFGFAGLGIPKLWGGEDADSKGSREIRDMEADMTVSDVQLYRKVAIRRILKEGIAASNTSNLGLDSDAAAGRGGGFTAQFPFSWWIQQNREESSSEREKDYLPRLHREILEKLHDYEPDMVLKRHIRTHMFGKFPCDLKLTGFNAAGEKLTVDFGSVDAEVKFFGSLVDSSRLAASEMTMSLFREDLYAVAQSRQSQSQEGGSFTPPDVCIPIFRSIDKLQKGHHRLLLTSASTAVGSGQGLNTWDRGIFQREFLLILNSFDISFDCKAYDTLHQLFNDVNDIMARKWREWDELPERWGRGGRRNRGRTDPSRGFGQRFARFRRGGQAARSANNVNAYDEPDSVDATAATAISAASSDTVTGTRGIPRSSSLRHVRSVDRRIDSLDESESGDVDESPNASLLHSVWRHAVACGLTDRDAVRIMLDHLHTQECTAPYYLYMWLQRLRVTRAQVNIWIRALPQTGFDNQLLEELYSLCSPELITDPDGKRPTALHDIPASIPRHTQHDTVKREGRKLLRCILNFPKISISAHINDPQSPTLLITAENIECGKTPAQFFDPEFIDKGDHSCYYETMHAKLSRTRAFVAPRDYLFHCMRNRKLNELSILSDHTEVAVNLRTLAVPKPIFVRLPRENYSLQFSGLAFVFSYDRLAKFGSIVRTFITSSEMLRSKPRDPDDLPGAIIYELNCPFVSVVFAQSKEVSLRVEAEMCSVQMTQPRWVNIEPATAAKSVDLQMKKLVIMVGDPTGIQDGSPTAVAELGGLVCKMGTLHERNLVIDSFTLSGCRPRNVSILSFAENNQDAESVLPVIVYRQGHENGKLVRSLTVAPVEVVYDADVFALLVDFFASSVGIPEFFKRGAAGISSHEVALASATPAAAEPTRISLDQDQQSKTMLVLHGVCIKLVLSRPALTVSIQIDKTVANMDDGHASASVYRVTMCTGQASEFFRAESRDIGNAVEISVGTRQATNANAAVDVLELSIQHPWCRIGYSEIIGIQRVSAALSKTVAQFRARDAELPLRSPLMGAASPNYLASPVPKHSDAPRLSHSRHCQVKINSLKLELYDSDSDRRSLVVQFSASCKHKCDEFESEAHQDMETKGRVTIKGLLVYFEKERDGTAVQSSQNLCLLQCSLVRPEYTIREQEKRRWKIVLEREQRSPAIVCQFCNEGMAELAAVCTSLKRAFSTTSSDDDHVPTFRGSGHARPAQLENELGMDLLFEDLRFYYVSGWGDAPLVRMLLKSMNNKPFVYRSAAKSEEPRLEAGMEICMDVLNAQISCWEPILEAVTVHVEHRNVRLGHSKLNIKASMVNLNVTRMFCALYREVQQRTEKESLDEWHDGEALAFSSPINHGTVPNIRTEVEQFPLEPAMVCIVRNETHTDLYFPRHTFRRTNDGTSTPRAATQLRGSRWNNPAASIGGLGMTDDGHSPEARRQSDVDEDDEDDEGEEHIPGNSACPEERELRSGVVTSDSSRHRAHRIQFRMDGFVPAVVDIEKIGVFPVVLRPKTVPSSSQSSSSSSTRDDVEDARGSVSLICKVTVIGGEGEGKSGKRVVIRSPVVIRNSSARSIDIKFGDHKVPGNFEPSGEELPLEVLHSAGHFDDGPLMVRPGRPGRVGNLYTWSRRLSGKTLSHMRQGLGRSFQLSCVAIDGSSADFVISVYIVNKDGQTYIEFLPPLVIENALACDIQVYMRDQTGGSMLTTDIECGGKSKVHEIDVPSGQNTMVITTAGFTGELRQQGNSWPEVVRLRNREGQSLVLATDVSDGHDSAATLSGSTRVKSGALFIVLYTSHWFLNHARVNINLVQQGVPDNADTPVPELEQAQTPVSQKGSANVLMRDTGSGLFNLESPRGAANEDALNGVKLSMLSFLPRSFVGDSDEKYDRTSIGNRLGLRCTEPGSSLWSEPTNVDVGKHLTLNLPVRSSGGDQFQLCTSIRSVPGVFHRTKLISFSPCVFLTNRTQGVLMIKDADHVLQHTVYSTPTTASESSNVVVLPDQASASEFHFKRGNDGHTKAQIHVRAVDFEWSRALQINHAADFYLFLRRQCGGSGNTFRVTVDVEGSTSFVAFQLLDQSGAQLRVENECKSSTVVLFRQVGILLSSLEVGSRASTMYSWEDPQLAHRLQIRVQSTDVSWEVDIDNPKRQYRCGDYVLHVIDAGGSTFVLRVMESATSFSVDPGTPVSFGNSRGGRGGTELQARTISWKLDLAGIGLSFIDNGVTARDVGHVSWPMQTGQNAGDAQELIHYCIYSVRLNAIVGAETEVDFYDLEADYMQIDNQWDRRLNAQRSVDSESNRWRGDKYSVVLAPTDKDIVPTGDKLPMHLPGGARVKSFLHVRVERLHSPGAVDCYRSVLVDLADMTIKLDGNLIERIVGPAELTTNQKSLMSDTRRTVWLFRGPAKAKHLDEIVIEQRQQLRRFTDAAAPRRIFIKGLKILPDNCTVTVSHSGRPSVLTTDGFANVPIRFTKFEGKHIHAAHCCLSKLDNSDSLLSKLRKYYGQQLAMKLPQFIGAASLFGNPAGVVQTFRQELESVVEESVASLRQLNLLDLKNTMITAVRRLFEKVTTGLGSTYHVAALTLNQQTSTTANSVVVLNFPSDIQPEELAEIFASHGAVALGVINFEPAAGETLQALARFSTADGMACALGLNGALLRRKKLSVKPQARAKPPSNPVAGMYRGLAYCLYYQYAGIRSLSISKCLVAPIQGAAAMVCQPISGLFGYYDELFLCLGRLYPREPYRASRQRIRSRRRFGRHGSIQPLTSGSSLDRDLLHFVEALDELSLAGPAAVVHQTHEFALLTTEHALVYVRRQPTLRLEWYIFAPCLLAYDVPTTFMQKHAQSDMNKYTSQGGRTRKSSAPHSQSSVDLLCLCPLQLASQVSARETNTWGSDRLRSLSVDIETESQVGPLLRRLRTWWICSRSLPVDNSGSHLATCISPGVVVRVPAFKAFATAMSPGIVGAAPRRGTLHAGSASSRPRIIQYHDISGGVMVPKSLEY